MGQNI